MLITRVPDLRWSDVTDRRLYLRRREFLRTAGAIAAAGVLAARPGSALAQGGARYDDLCGCVVEWLGEEQGIARAGEWLGQWLRDGLIAGIRR